jgi:hypothetical protein
MHAANLLPFLYLGVSIANAMPAATAHKGLAIAKRQIACLADVRAHPHGSLNALVVSPCYSISITDSIRYCALFRSSYV